MNSTVSFRSNYYNTSNINSYCDFCGSSHVLLYKPVTLNFLSRKLNNNCIVFLRLRQPCPRSMQPKLWIIQKKSLDTKSSLCGELNFNIYFIKIVV